MAVDSTYTDAQLLAAAENSISYATADSEALAQTFIEAVGILMLRRPDSITDPDGRALSFNLEYLDRMAQRAEAWLAAKRGGRGSVLHRSLEGFRE